MCQSKLVKGRTGKSVSKPGIIQIKRKRGKMMREISTDGRRACDREAWVVTGIQLLITV
jgi:hypothetical protein